MFVPVTVVLELEWVLRAFYGFGSDEFGAVMEHLTGLPNVTVEDWTCVLDATALHLQGLDLADALHLVRSTRCNKLLTFDDRKFARRADRMQTTPPVVVPKTGV